MAKEREDVASTFLSRLPPVTADAVLPVKPRANGTNEVETWVRRCRVARAMLEGASTPRDIVQHLGLDRGYLKTVQKDVLAVIEEWRKHVANDVESGKAKATLRFERILSELWESWYKSKEPRRVVKRRRDGTVEEQHVDGLGDPAIMKQIIDAARELNKIAEIGAELQRPLVERNTVLVASEGYFKQIHERANQLREGNGVPKEVEGIDQAALPPPATPEPSEKNDAPL